jgi:hypothetical protein
MKEEKLLLEKMGRHEPFTVPDGYFDSLTERVMSRLPEKEAPAEKEDTLWERVKPWVYMTAMFMGLMCSMRLWMERPEEPTVPALTASDAALFTDEEMELITDRSMMDDYALYQYLSEETEEQEP